ncbi:MAG: MFS transporter [Candidatus Lokiarchaeota archaeon]|nr:MFS transporter [Candidatus Lokiarchaeota archaeon]
MGLYLFFYYHTVIGLAPFAIFLATGINTVWGAFNDPLIGYLTDKNFKWTRKWGRRFPWMVMGLIPWCFIIILIFSSPDATVNPWPAFIWLLTTLLLNELFITLSDVHGNMLRADKFRTEFERRKYSGYFGIFDMIAVVLGTAIPPLLIFGAGKEYYTIMAAIIAVIALVCAIIFLLFGAREDKIMIDRYYSSNYEHLKFLKGTIGVLKQKSFMGFWFSAAGFGIANTMMTAMVAYVTTFVLQVPEEIMTLLFALFITGGMISVPIWLKILKKVNDTRKLYLIGSVIFCIALIPLTFFVSLYDLAIFMFIAGFAIGCVWTLQIPVLFSHVQDDFVVRTGRNQKGILIGAWAVLGLFTAFIDELLFAIVFTITGFKEGFPTYALLEAEVGVNAMIPIVWGIKFLIGVIPMIIMALGTVAFWKLYPLTQDKVSENKAKLKDIGF